MGHRYSHKEAYELAPVVAAAAAVALVCTPARAGECGSRTPDYTASRTVSVGGKTVTSLVAVSGDKMREEQHLGSHKLILLHLFGERKEYIIDPERKMASSIPAPANGRQPNMETRIVEEKGADGLTVRHAQFKSRDKWVELSTTSCRADGVMARQTFYSMDPQGRIVSGRISQSDIRVGPLPANLFELPSDVTIKSP